MSILRSEISAQTPQMRGFVLYGDAQSRYVLKILSIREKTANPSFCGTGFFLLEWRQVSLIGTDVLAPYPRLLNAFNDFYFSTETSKSPALLRRGLTGQPELFLALQAERSTLGPRRAERIADEGTQVRPRSLNAFNSQSDSALRSLLLKNKGPQAPPTPWAFTESLNAFNDLKKGRTVANSPAQGRPDAHCAERQAISWPASLKPTAHFVCGIRLRVVSPHIQHRTEQKEGVVSSPFVWCFHAFLPASCSAPSNHGAALNAFNTQMADGRAQTSGTGAL